MILCFWVVIFHNLKLNNKYLINIIKIKIFHVPTFFFISFYFLYNNLSKRDINKIKNRFDRLFVPYIFLPIIVFILNNLLYIITKFNRFYKLLTFKDLTNQLIYGFHFIPVFWFQFNLIFLTILFFIISFLFKKNYLFIFQIIGIISYILQYSNYNYLFFESYKFIIKYSIGILVETAPISVTAISFASLNIMKRLCMSREKTIFFSIIFLYFLFHYNIFTDIKGYPYTGLIKNFGAIFLFTLFFLIPLNNKNKNIYIFIKTITSYTNGIYSLHLIVTFYYRMKVKTIKYNNLSGCIIIYLISYFISFIGIKIFGNTKLKYLFI